MQTLITRAVYSRASILLDNVLLAGVLLNYVLRLTIVFWARNNQGTLAVVINQAGIEGSFDRLDSLGSQTQPHWQMHSESGVYNSSFFFPTKNDLSPIRDISVDS